MFWITVLLLLLMGTIAAADHLGRTLPPLKDFGRAFKPFEGWIGVAGAAWGVLSIIDLLIHIKLVSVAPIFWIFSVLIGVLLVLLGFVLGLPAVSSFLSGDLKGKVQAQHRKLAPRRVSLGTSSLITAGLSILMRLLQV